MAVEGSVRGPNKGAIPQALLSLKDGKSAERTYMKPALSQKNKTQQRVVDHEVPTITRGQSGQVNYPQQNAINSYESGRQSVPQEGQVYPGTSQQIQRSQPQNTNAGGRPQSSHYDRTQQGAPSQGQRYPGQTQGINSRLGHMLNDPSGGAYPAVKFQQPQAYVPVEVESDEQNFQRTDEVAHEELYYDPIHPPAGYFSTLSTAELDPRNYKHVPNLWMNRIPCAGKPLNRDDQSRPLLG